MTVETVQLLSVCGGRGAEYDTRVTNPAHVQKGVKRLLVNEVETDDIPPIAAGATYGVEVVLG